MDHIHATLKKASEEVSLDPHLKDGFRRTLEVMTASSVPQAAARRMSRSLSWALAAVIVATSGATVTYASTKSVPGDVLYSTKVKALEPLESALALTPEAKADVAVAHLERRFQEAAALSAAGTLDEHDDELAALASSDVSTVEGEDQPVARARFEALAANYAPVISRRKEGRGKFAEAVRLGDLKDVVSDHVAEITAREQLAIAQSQRDSAEGNNSDDVAVIARLKASHRLTEDANAELQKGSFRAALELSGAAAKIATEARIFSTLGASTSTQSTHGDDKDATSTTSTRQVKQEDEQRSREQKKREGDSRWGRSLIDDFLR